MGWKDDAENGAPGPWFAKVFYEDGEGHRSFKVSPQRGTFGTVFEPDARRIARVPLYEEVVRAAEEVVRRFNGSSPTEVVDDVRAVDALEVALTKLNAS